MIPGCSRVSRFLFAVGVIVRKVEKLINWLLFTCLVFVAGLVGYWYYDSHMDGPATTMIGSRIRVNNIFHQFDKLRVDFITTRYKSCSLDVNRIAQRMDTKSIMGDQGHVVDHVLQYFKGDGIPRASFYEIPLQDTLPPGDYEIWSEGVYVCNPLDKLIPHTIVTDRVPFKIVPENVPIPNGAQ